MNSAIEALVDRYADWLIERHEAGERPTAYLFEPDNGGNPNANHRLLERLGDRSIPVVWIDKREWQTSKQGPAAARLAQGAS